MNKFEAMKSMARTYPHREVCGFVVVADGVETLLPVRNVHPSPKHNFAMHHATQEQYLNMFLADITGMFHSHNNKSAKPSQDDIDSWPEFEGSEDWDYFIVADGEVWEWELDEDREPYGRQVA